MIKNKQNEETPFEQNNNIEAYYKDGLAYYDGNDVEENDELALSWFMTAAKRGHAKSQYMLALMYHEGFGLDKQREEIEENDEDGDGVDEWENSIKEEAISLFLAAAKQGDIDAQYMLGHLYYDGVDDVLEQDHEEAFAWFMRAAEQGDPQSQEKIAEMYRDGEGVEEDDEQAEFWSAKAEAQDDDESKRKHRSDDSHTLQKMHRKIDNGLKVLRQATTKMLSATDSLPDDDEEEEREGSFPHFSPNDHDAISDAIDQRKSFVVVSAVDTSSVAKQIESLIESKQLSCRVRVNNRAVSIAAGLAIPVVGVAAAAAIGVHNLFTMNPDYEVIKCLVDDSVEVMYQK